MNILIIEDNGEHADLIKYHLHKSTIRTDIEVANCFQAGVEIFSRFNPDLVLLDLSLPDIEIDQTVPRAVEEFKGIPIVVLTSLNDQETGVAALKAGAQDYIPKINLNKDIIDRSIRYSIERNRQTKRS